jgi:hypothetical protein
MKRFVILTALLTFIAGTFATMVPAAADPHGDRMRNDCKSGARKCRSIAFSSESLSRT